MKVFLTGATGVLGRHTIPLLRERGHTVTALARNPANEEAIKALKATPKTGRLWDVDALEDAMRGSDAVMHLATSFRKFRRGTKRQRGRNDMVRRGGAATLMEAAQATGIKRFVLPSIAWLARPADGARFDETSTPQPDKVTTSMMLAETHVQEQAQSVGMKWAIPRLGFLYSADSSQLRFFAKGLAAGRMGTLGPGRAQWAMLHAHDAATALAATLKQDVKDGIWHVVDDEPVASYDFLAAIANRLGARPPARLPKILAYLLAGRHAVRFFSRPTLTNNARAKKELGWKPKYPDYRKGLDEVVATWKAEGFPKKVKPPKDEKAPSAKKKAAEA